MKITGKREDDMSSIIHDGLQDDSDLDQPLAKFRTPRRSSTIKLHRFSKDGIAKFDKMSAETSKKASIHETKKNHGAYTNDDKIQDEGTEQLYMPPKAREEKISEDSDGDDTILAKVKMLRKYKKGVHKAALKDGMKENMEAILKKRDSSSSITFVQEKSGQVKHVLSGQEKGSHQHCVHYENHIMEDSAGDDTVIAYFKRSRRSTNAVIKAALKDDMGHEVQLNAVKDKVDQENHVIGDISEDNIVSENIRRLRMSERAVNKAACTYDMKDKTECNIRNKGTLRHNAGHEKTDHKKSFLENTDGNDTVLANLNDPHRTRKANIKILSKDSIECNANVSAGKLSNLPRNAVERRFESDAGNIDVDAVNRDILPQDRFDQEKCVFKGSDRDDTVLANLKKPCRSKKTAIKAALGNDEDIAQVSVEKEDSFPRSVVQDKHNREKHSMENSDGEDTVLASFKRLRQSKKLGIKAAKGNDRDDGSQFNVGKGDGLTHDTSREKVEEEKHVLERSNRGVKLPPSLKKLHRSRKAGIKRASEDVIEDTVKVMAGERETFCHNVLQDKVDQEQHVGEDSSGEDIVLAKLKRPHRSKKATVKTLSEYGLEGRGKVNTEKGFGLPHNSVQDNADRGHVIGESIQEDTVLADFRRLQRSRKAVSKAVFDSEPETRAVLNVKKVGSLPADDIQEKASRDKYTLETFEGKDTALANLKKPRQSKKAEINVALKDDRDDNVKADVGKGDILPHMKAERTQRTQEKEDTNGEDAVLTSFKKTYRSRKKIIKTSLQDDLQNEDSLCCNALQEKLDKEEYASNLNGKDKLLASLEKQHASEKAVVKASLEDDMKDRVNASQPKEDYLPHKSVQEKAVHLKPPIDDSSREDTSLMSVDGLHRSKEKKMIKAHLEDDIVNKAELGAGNETCLPYNPVQENANQDKCMLRDPERDNTVMAHIRSPQRSRKIAMNDSLQDEMGDGSELNMGNGGSSADNSAQETSDQEKHRQLRSSPSGTFEYGMEVKEDEEKTLAKMKSPHRSKKLYVMNAQEAGQIEAMGTTVNKESTYIRNPAGSKPDKDFLNNIRFVQSRRESNRILLKNNDGSTNASVEETTSELKTAWHSKKPATVCVRVSEDVEPFAQLKDEEIAKQNNVSIQTMQDKVKREGKMEEEKTMIAVGEKRQSLNDNVHDDKEDASQCLKGKKQRRLTKDQLRLCLSSGQVSVTDTDVEVAISSQKADNIRKLDIDSNPNGSQSNFAAKRYSDFQCEYRHEGSAYEGNLYRDDLMDKELTKEHRSVNNDEHLDQSRPRGEIQSGLLVEAVPADEAAVSAGLKFQQVLPIEKIRFKEVLKCRGGLQEYLECRNSILWLWSKDVCRILPLSDCGVNADPQPDEAPRAALIRDIYKFLDCHGYINIGILVKKPRAEDASKPKVQGLSKSIRTENHGHKAVDADEDIDSARVPHDCGRHSLMHNSQTSAPHLEKSQASLTSRVDSLSQQQQRIIVIGAGPSGLIAARHLERQNIHVTVLEARDRIGGRVHTDRTSLSVPVDLGASIIAGIQADVTTERRPDPSALLCMQLGLELSLLNSNCPLYDSVTGQRIPLNLDEALEIEFNALLDNITTLVENDQDAVMSMSLEDGFDYVLKKRYGGYLGFSNSDKRNTKEFKNSDFTRTTEISLDEHLRYENSEVKHEVQTTTEDNRSEAAVEYGQMKMLDSFDATRYDCEIFNPVEQRVLDWHFANIEHRCAAELKLISLANWNQDDAYGGFGGAHSMIKNGFSTVMEGLAEGLNIHLSHVVTEIKYNIEKSDSEDNFKRVVKVRTDNGQQFVGDAALITIPLGCLKSNTIKFSPELPDWKLSSIKRLGFGIVNKVAMEFPKVFWDESIDYFGATAENANSRGNCFIFWNLKKTIGAPVLIALVVGKAATDGKDGRKLEHVQHAVMVLRKLFGENVVPEPVASVTTNWGADPFSQGSYSYVALGASGEDYDILGRPVENCLFFAGEATCKEHPDTVGGAIMSGVREAGRIINILENCEDPFAQAEAMVRSQRLSDIAKTEVRDMMERLNAWKLPRNLSNCSIDVLEKSLIKDGLLQDMFGNAKTTAGRLYLVKRMLELPGSLVNEFVSTKEGLSILNNWILESLGKDGTQLLRHCVRLLLFASPEILAVEESGVAETVKEKVCVHTSRDICAIATKLVNMWTEAICRNKSKSSSQVLNQETAHNSGPSYTLKVTPEDQATMQIPFLTGLNARQNIYAFAPQSSKGLEVHSSKVEVEKEQEQEADLTNERNIGKEILKLGEVSILADLEAKAIAAEAAAAQAAAAYAPSEAECATFRELPKIPSFHEFAKREHVVHKEDSEGKKRKWCGTVLGNEDFSEVDSKSCRMKNWSADFNATSGNLDSLRSTGSDFGGTVSNKKQRNQSHEITSHLNLKEESGETGMVFIKGIKLEGENSGTETPNTTEKQAYDNSDKGDTEGESSKALLGTRCISNDEPRGTEHIKKCLTDYVASLLMPLYKTRRIDRDGYKSIMKKSMIKVLERNTPVENSMSISEFLDCRRRNKIRFMVDKFIEKHLANSGS